MRSFLKKYLFIPFLIAGCTPIDDISYQSQNNNGVIYPYVYITTTAGFVYSCPLVLGVIQNASSCNISKGFGAAYGASISGAVGYVADGAGNIYSCPLANGVFPNASSCTVSTGFNSAKSISVSGNYAYIPDDFGTPPGTSSTVYSCHLTASGTVPNAANCSASVGYAIPYSVVVAGNFAYIGTDNIAAPDNTWVYSCPLTAGVLPAAAASCTKNLFFDNYQGVEVYGNNAFIVNTSISTIYTCPISGGIIPTYSSCATSTVNFVNSTGNFSVSSSNIYIPSNTSSIYTCPLTGGTFPTSTTNCITATGFPTGTLTNILVSQ